MSKKWGILDLANSLGPSSQKSVWEEGEDWLAEKKRKDAADRAASMALSPIDQLNKAPQAVRLGARRALPVSQRTKVNPAPDQSPSLMGQVLDNNATPAMPRFAPDTRSTFRKGVDAWEGLPDTVGTAGADLVKKGAEYILPDGWADELHGPAKAVIGMGTEMAQYTEAPILKALSTFMPKDVDDMVDFRGLSGLTDKAGHFIKRGLDNKATERASGLTSKLTNLPEYYDAIKERSPHKDIPGADPRYVIGGWMGKKALQGIEKIDPDAPSDFIFGDFGKGEPVGNVTVPHPYEGPTAGDAIERGLKGDYAPHPLVHLLKQYDQGKPGADKETVRKAIEYATLPQGTNPEAPELNDPGRVEGDGAFGFALPPSRESSWAKMLSTLPRDLFATAAMAPMMASWATSTTDPKDDVDLAGHFIKEGARDFIEPWIDPATARERSLMNTILVKGAPARKALRHGMDNLAFSKNMPKTGNEYLNDFDAGVWLKRDAVAQHAKHKQRNLEHTPKIDELRQSLGEVNQSIKDNITPPEGMKLDTPLQQKKNMVILRQKKAAVQKELQTVGKEWSSPRKVEQALGHMKEMDAALAKTKAHHDIVMLLQGGSALASGVGVVLSAPDIAGRLLRRKYLDTTDTKSKWLWLQPGHRFDEATKTVIREAAYDLSKREGELRDILYAIKPKDKPLVFDVMNMEADWLMTEPGPDGARRAIFDYDPQAKQYKIAEGLQFDATRMKDLDAKLATMNEYAVPMREFTNRLTQDAKDLNLFHDEGSLIEHYFPNIYNDSQKALKKAKKLGFVDSLVGDSGKVRRDLGTTSAGNRFMTRTLADVPIERRVGELGMRDDLNRVAGEGLGQLMTDLNAFKKYRKLREMGEKTGKVIDKRVYETLPPENRPYYRLVPDDLFIMDDDINAEFRQKVAEHQAAGKSKKAAETLAHSEHKQANKARVAADKAAAKLESHKSAEAKNQATAAIHAKYEAAFAEAEASAKAGVDAIQDPRVGLKEARAGGKQAAKDARSDKAALEAKLKAAQKDLKAAEKAKRDLKTEQTRHEKAVKAKVAAAAKLERVKEGGHIKKAEAEDATARQAYERQKEAIASGSNKKKQEHARALLKKREKQLAAMAEDSPKRAQQEKSVSNARAKYELSLEDDGYKLARLGETQAATGRALTTARRNQLLKDTTAKLAKASELVEGHAAAIAKLEPLTKRDFSSLRAKVAGLEHRIKEGGEAVKSKAEQATAAKKADVEGKKSYRARMKAVGKQHAEMAKGLNAEVARALGLDETKKVKLNAAKLLKKAETSAKAMQDAWNRMQLELGELQRMGDTDGRMAETKHARQQHEAAPKPYNPPKKYGELAGKYMDADLIYEMEQIAKIAKSMQSTFGRLNRMMKVHKTAYSVTTTMRNLWTNVFLFAPMAETPGGRSATLTDPRNLKIYEQTRREMTDGKHGYRMREGTNDLVTSGTLTKAEIGQPMGHLRGLFDTVEGAFSGFAEGAVDLVKGNPKGRFNQAFKKFKRSAGDTWALPVRGYSALDDIFRMTYYKLHMMELEGKYSPDKLAFIERARRREVTPIDFKNMPRKERLEFKKAKAADKAAGPPTHQQRLWYDEWKNDRKEASLSARKYFIDYENVAGWVQIVRAPIHWSFHVLAQPFMAFPAQATPLMIRWYDKNPIRAMMYQNLFDSMTQHNIALGIEELGFTEKMGDPEEGDYGADIGTSYAERESNRGPLKSPFEIARTVPLAAFGKDYAFDGVDSDGQPVLNELDAAHMNPLNFFTPVYNANKGWLENLIDNTTRYISSNPITGTIIELVANRDFYSDKQIAPDKANAASRALLWADHTTRKLLPPLTPNIGSLMNTIGPEYMEYGEEPPEGEQRKLLSFTEANDWLIGRGGTEFDRLVSGFIGRKDFRGRQRTFVQALQGMATGFKLSQTTQRETLTDRLRGTLNGISELSTAVRREMPITPADVRADPHLKNKLTAKESAMLYPTVVRLLADYTHMRGVDPLIDGYMDTAITFMRLLPGAEDDATRARHWKSVKKAIRKAAGIELKSQVDDAKEK